MTTTTKIFPKIQRYKREAYCINKWEAYCETNRRSTDSFSLSSERRGTGRTAMQIGGVLQYKLEVYCNICLRSSGGGWGFWHSSDSWETDSYPVLVPGGTALFLWGCQTAAQYWIKIAHPWIQKFCPVLGLGSGGRLLRHFQTPALYWINVSRLKVAKFGETSVKIA